MKTLLPTLILLISFSIHSQSVEITYLEDGEMTLSEEEGRIENDYIIQSDQHVLNGTKIVHGKDTFQLYYNYIVKHYHTEKMYVVRVYKSRVNGKKRILRSSLEEENKINLIAKN